MTEVKIIDNYTVIEYEKSNIYVIENLFDDEMCDELISLINTTKLSNQMYHKQNNVLCHMTTINELLRKDDTFYYVFPTQVTKQNKEILRTNQLSGITHSYIYKIQNDISKKIKIIAKIMNNVNDRLLFRHNSGIILRKIYGETLLHSDGIYEKALSPIGTNYISENGENGPDVYYRQSSCIFALNDDHEGGIFEFPYQKVSIKLKKGSAIIFPPYWTHPHRVTELNNTFRYTISTWFCEKPFEKKD